MHDSAAPAHDVVIVGAGLAGLSAAIRLRQTRPALRVLLLDEKAAPKRGRGEALSEVAAFFLGRTLGLSAHLNECHYTRQGARFWFANGDPAQTFDACSEIGPRYLSRLPSYLVDRAVLDAEMLRNAAVLGAECRRPATVEAVKLTPGGMQELMLAGGETIRARWVVDASGSAALLARQEGWRRPGAAQPARAIWARWRGIKDLDGSELRRKYPKWAAQSYGMRNPAIQHLTGEGWWSGWAPVRGGEVSVSLVGGPPMTTAAELQAFLEAKHPMARELFAGAALVEGTTGAHEELVFRSETIAGNGFALVGGAAGFIDWLYGAHLDWTACTVLAAVDLIAGSGAPRADFATGYARWFDAVYRDKYAYLGEFDLMSVAHLFDLGRYYFGVARPMFEEGEAALQRAPFATRRWQELVNRRCARMAEVRGRRGMLGRSNADRRVLFTPFNFNRGNAAPMVAAFRRWIWLELTEGWRSWA